MSIVDLIFPKMCVGCRREGSYICENCQKNLVKPEPICPMCCKPSLDGWTHPRCRRNDGMERLVVGLPYKGVVQDCLKKVKYKSSWDIVRFLYSLCETPDFRDCVIVSVPMWREKEYKRGFNQAQIIAELLAKNENNYYRNILERTRETRPMFGLKRKARKENIANAFRIINNQIPIIKQVQHSNDQKSQRVILVDDVWTTGATMKECSRVLKRIGIKEVWGFALAR